MNLSGGPYSYNRFDEYEKALKEASKPDYLDFDGDGNEKEPMKKALKEKGASNPQEMRKKVDKAGKKSKVRGKGLTAVDEKEEKKEEENTAGDNGGDGGMSEAYGDLAQRKVEKLNNTTKAKAEAKVMSEAQEQRMAMYSRALGVMGAHYSGPGFGVSQIEEKKDDEPTDERKAAADRADEEKRQKKEGKKGEAHETKEIEKLEDKELSKEEVQLTKEMVVEYLVNEGYANNEVSAEILHKHISDEFLEEIEGRVIAEMGPAYPSETSAQAKAQGDHRMSKSSAGLKTGKNPGLKMSHTSGANKQA